MVPWSPPLRLACWKEKEGGTGRKLGLYPGRDRVRIFFLHPGDRRLDALAIRSGRRRGCLPGLVHVSPAMLQVRSIHVRRRSCAQEEKVHRDAPGYLRFGASRGSENQTGLLRNQGLAHMSTSRSSSPPDAESRLSGGWMPMPVPSCVSWPGQPCLAPLGGTTAHC